MSLLPEAERNAYLLRVARGESHVGVELLRRLRAVGRADKPTTSTAPRRTFAELQSAAKSQEQLRIQRERAEAEAKLADLARREAQVWASIPGLLAKRTASGYDEGVALLAELRDLAVHQRQRVAFDAPRRDNRTLYWVAGAGAPAQRQAAGVEKFSYARISQTDQAPDP